MQSNRPSVAAPSRAASGVATIFLYSHVRPLGQIIPIPVALGLAAAGAALIWRILEAARPNPAARERKRRLAVNARGRMADATLLDLSGDALHYSYWVRGVQYSASQDISGVRDRLPDDSKLLAGSALVKYVAGNPANSIVVCEERSGLRVQPQEEPAIDHE